MPRSVELNSVLALLAGVLVLKSVGPNALAQIIALMDGSFRNLVAADWTVASLFAYGGAIGTTYVSIMLPLFFAVMGVGIGVNFLQSGFVLTTQPLSPDFSRINPLKGFQRMFSPRSLAELVKSVAKLGIVGYVVFQTFEGKFPQIVSLSGTDIRGAAGAVADVGMEILLKTGFALLALAVLDFGYQRWEHERKLKMTKVEIKEELKQSEGDPKTKGKIRQQQRQNAARRMMQSVPSSDVVITNPTHLAVAIQYRSESMRAPKVVAKGQLLIAERIKEIAREHGVPVLENKPLAQALFKSTEVGGEVPPALYRALAEILVFMYGLRQQRRMGGQVIGG